MVLVDDLPRLAQRRLPKVVFDYLDGGAEGEVTLRENRRAFETIAFRPRQAVAIGERDLRTWFCLRGPMERWRDPAGDIVETCTILTVKSNSLVADAHDRMPAILSAERYDLWLESWCDRCGARHRLS